MMQLTRRAALLGLTSAFAFGRASLALAAAPTERRFVVVILRGALDGYVRGGAVWRSGACRPARAIAWFPEGLLDLGGFYGLHPSLTELARDVSGRRTSASPCGRRPHRVRSHFEAQDCLESGADHRMTSGWLNRAVAALPDSSVAVPKATRWRLASRSPCCCAVR